MCVCERGGGGKLLLLAALSDFTAGNTRTNFYRAQTTSGLGFNSVKKKVAVA